MPPPLAEHLPTIIDCKGWDTLFAVGCLHEWQDLWAGILAFAAGLLGFAAAIWAVSTTLRGEQRKAHRELAALKKGLGAEARHFARAAYDGAASLIAKLNSQQSMKIIDIENWTQFPSPVLYEGNSSSLGLLGDQTPQVVLFYNKIEVIVKTSARLRIEVESIISKGISYAISKEQVAQIIQPLLDACEIAVSFLPSLKTGTPLDKNDAVYPEKVKALREGWERLKP